MASDERQAENGKNATSIPQKRVAAFSVIGIAARTINARESGSDGVIPQQWKKFFEEGILDKIPDKIGSDVYALYTDYASDHNGEYTFVIGATVKPGTASPAGMVVVNIPAGTYAVVTSDKGPSWQVVPAAWQQIFRLESDGKLHRTYKADFEVYDQSSQGTGDVQVEICLGLK